MPGFVFGYSYRYDPRTLEQRERDAMKDRRSFRKRRRRSLSQAETSEQLIARLAQYPRPFPRPS